MERNLVGFLKAELLHHHHDRSRGRVLQRDFHFQLVRLGGLPFCRKALALFVFQTNFADTNSARRLQMESILSPDNQRTRVFGCDNPLRRARGPQAEASSVERTETPESAQDSSTLAGQTGRWR